MTRLHLAILAVLTVSACSPSVPEAPAEPLVMEDVVYGHKLGMALTLDVHAPAEPNGAGIVYLDSSSWVSPSCVLFGRDTEGRCSSPPPSAMLDAGFTVFTVRHGSSPRFNVREATEDVGRAVRYVRENASSFGVDPANLGVWGASAGGQLALMLGLAPEISASPDAQDAPPIRAIAAYMAPHSVEVVDPAMLELVPALNMPADVQREVSPIYYVSADDPPTLLVHGDQDSVVPIGSSEAMYAALSAAGVATEFITLEGAGHGFSGEDAEAALAASVAWFERHLGG